MRVNTDRTFNLLAIDSGLIIPAGKPTKSSAANIKVQVSPAECRYIFNGRLRTKFRRGLSHSLCLPPVFLSLSLPLLFSRLPFVPSRKWSARFFTRFHLTYSAKVSAKVIRVGSRSRRLPIFFRKSAEVNGPLIDRFGFDVSTCSIVRPTGRGTPCRTMAQFAGGGRGWEKREGRGRRR